MADTQSRGNRSKESRPTENERIQFDPGYVVHTLFGKLRIAQIISSLLAGATTSGIHFILKECSGSQFQFHGFVSWLVFVNVLIILILHLLNLYKRVASIFQKVVLHLVLCFGITVALLISSSVTAAYSWCGWQDLQKGLAIASAFFGFTCAITFILEFLLHFKELRDGSMETTSSRPAATA